MHDFSLGPPVDVGCYDGPMVEGKPLHTGNCEDGVYGCRRCNSATRRFTPELLQKMGWPATQNCDWCNTEVPVGEISGVKPIDEGGRIYYEICRTCSNKYDTEIAKELEEIC